MNPITVRSARHEAGGSQDASAIVSALYADHALGLTPYLRAAVLNGCRDVPFTGKTPNPYDQSVTDDVFPFPLWTSPDARVSIGLTDGGHAVGVRDGRTRRIPWPLSIAIPFGANAPGAAW